MRKILTSLNKIQDSPKLAKSFPLDARSSLSARALLVLSFIETTIGHK